MSEVLTRIEGTLGRITLNRPRALNALTLDMVRTIHAALDDWQADDAIHAVLLDGAGDRGLCAGGDIRALYDAAIAGDEAFPREFFRTEYRLNAAIARFAKPYIAFMDGIVMGGGIGLSAHGAFRVVTERSRLAMPETGIGFLPEVGGTWLLGRAPGQLGVHAALTAANMGAADAIACGLADTCVESTRLPELADALTRCMDAQDIAGIIEGFASAPALGAFARGADWIAACYAHDIAEDILASLERSPDADAQKAAADMKTKSPTSLKVTLRALREAPHLGALEPCLEQEFRLAMACMRSHDFPRRRPRRGGRQGPQSNLVAGHSRGGRPRHRGRPSFSAPDHGGLGLAPANTAMGKL